MFLFVVFTDSYILEEETKISTSAWIQNWHAQVVSAPSSPQVSIDSLQHYYPLVAPRLVSSIERPPTKGHGALCGIHMEIQYLRLQNRIYREQSHTPM